MGNIRHGAFWRPARNQRTSHVYTDYGTKAPDDVHTVPLATVESDREFSFTGDKISSGKLFRSIRYFEEK